MRELFRAAIKSPATRDPYERRLLNFLDYVKLSPDEFVTLGRNQSATVEKKVMSFIAAQKARVEKGRNNRSHCQQLPKGSKIAAGDE